MEDHSTYTEQITLDEGDVDYRGLMRPSAPAALRRAHGHRPRLGPGDGQSLLQRAAHGLSGGRQGLPVLPRARHAGDRHLDHLPRKDPPRGQQAGPGGAQAWKGRSWPGWTPADAGGHRRRQDHPAHPEEMDRYWSDTIDWELSLQVPKAAQLTSAGRPAGGLLPLRHKPPHQHAAYLDVVCDALPADVMARAPCSTPSSSTTARCPWGRRWSCSTARRERGRPRLVCDRPPGRQGRVRAVLPLLSGGRRGQKDVREDFTKEITKK